ncbi:uncharacterized protein LOC130216144 isoform X2 [Danio aesculapii]|uniref:uncharacterized protein LOC130216144 isoform X2 n=1 Tax=Danio aesculapii TaxID=1142201 RepID=UPI0024BFE274|nr:uncharacterized protein LOC130216144 isoform X2 [Danio aesculapii]
MTIHVFNLLLWILIFLVCGSTYPDIVSISVTEGDSVTLHTGVQTNLDKYKDIIWYFNGIRIAQIIADLRFICTDVQCNEGTERFNDKLKLDIRTGSLTIRDIRKTHSGEYHLVVKSSREKIFNVTVHDDPAGDQDELKEHEGESVTFNPAVIREPNHVLTWYFDDMISAMILMAEITVNQSQICTDVQCKERFTDRLKLHHETGSLTVTKTRITDSGNYTSEIFISSDGRFSISKEKRFSLNIIYKNR